MQIVRAGKWVACAVGAFATLVLTGCGDARAPIAPSHADGAGRAAVAAASVKGADTRTSAERERLGWVLKEHDRLARVITAKAKGWKRAASPAERCEQILAAIGDEVPHIAAAGGASVAELQQAVSRLRQQPGACQPNAGRSLSLFAPARFDGPISGAAFGAAWGVIGSLPDAGYDAFSNALSRGYDAASSFSGDDALLVYATVDAAASSYGTWASYGTDAGSPFYGATDPYLTLFRGGKTFGGAARADGAGFLVGVQACSWAPAWQFKLACGLVGFAATSLYYVLS